MNEHLQELTTYIQQQLSQGVSEATLRQALRQYSWDDQLVNTAFQTLAQQTPPGTYQPLATVGYPLATPSDADQIRSKHLLSGRQVRSAVLWIVSPLIILLIAVIVNVVAASISGKPSVLKTVATIISGIGTVMLVVGPSVGIFKLYRLRRK